MYCNAQKQHRWLCLIWFWAFHKMKKLMTTDTNHNFFSLHINTAYSGQRGLIPLIFDPIPPPPFWYPPFWNFQDDHFNLPKNMPIKHANLQGKNIRIFLKHTDLLKMKFLQKKKKILRADRGYFRNWRQHPAKI